MIIKRELKDARALLDAYPNDSDTTMAWGCAFLSIVEMFERTGYELPEDETLEKFKNPQDFVKSFGPEFDQAKKDIKRATEINPFVPILLNEAGLFALEASDVATFGGPYEAIEYLHVWAIIWHAAGLPMIFMMASVPKNIKKHLKNRAIADEFYDVAEQIQDYEGPPWWQEFDEIDPHKAKGD